MNIGTWPQRIAGSARIKSPELVAQLFVLLVCGCVLGLTAWRVSVAREEALADSRVDSTNLARSMADHAHATVEAADILAFGLVERLQTDGTGPAALERLHRHMASRIAQVPGIRDLRVVSAEGILIAGALPNEPIGIDLSDREMFIYHRDHADMSVHIGPPIQSRPDNRWTLTITRRFNRPDGSFGGATGAAIDFDVFDRFYDSFNVGTHGSITLVNADSTILVRRPRTLQVAGTSISAGKPYQAFRSGKSTGSLEAVSVLDGINRITSFRAVDAYPLVVFVSLATEDSLIHWKADALAAFAAAGVVAMVLGMLGWHLSGQVRLRHLAELTVRRREEQYRLLAEHGTDLVVQLGPDWRRVYVSPSSRALLGYSPEEMLGHHPFEITHPDDQAALGEQIEALGTDAIKPGFTYRSRHKDGHYIWFEPIGTRLADGQGFVVTLRDVTRRHVAEGQLHEANNQLQRMAMLDGMTGIANRRCFDIVLQKEYRRAVRSELPLAVLMLDVDRFKAFNDTYGHPAGDACLNAIAKAIESLSRRPADLAARYGGEEFAVLLPETDQAGATALAELVRQAVRRLGIAHAVNPDRIATVSIGVAVIWPQDQGPSTLDLVSMADTALYRAKAAGRDRVCVHAQEQEQEQEQEQVPVGSLASNVDRAVL